MLLLLLWWHSELLKREIISCSVFVHYLVQGALLSVKAVTSPTLLLLNLPLHNFCRLIRCVKETLTDTEPLGICVVETCVSDS